ncbi:MAG: hypothetical protein LCH89_00400 [Proteobacteria bacterium]|nr:hypothetical protein [Pseudomonadota bacterium]
MSPEKELLHAYSAVVVDAEGGLSNPVTARVYGSRHGDGAGRLWASVWTAPESLKGGGASGWGYVTGCGYHKPSAAIAVALRAAGWLLPFEVSGCGHGTTIRALEAVAMACVPGAARGQVITH